MSGGGGGGVSTGDGRLLIGDAMHALKEKTPTAAVLIVSATPCEPYKHSEAPTSKESWRRYLTTWGGRQKEMAADMYQYTRYVPCTSNPEGKHRETQQKESIVQQYLSCTCRVHGTWCFPDGTLHSTAVVRRHSRTASIK